MATYKKIQDYVRERHGYTPKTCWIADVKEQAGIRVSAAPNRIGTGRMNPCPPKRVPHILAALKYFGMI
jgi:hypothetical protein